jgi:hypothetical protein
VATFQLYNDTAESVDIWVDNLAPALDASGGFRRDTLYDLEGGASGFISGSTSGAFNQEWAWGAPSAGPSGAHSGTQVWATVLDGDYNPESGDDARYIRRTFNIPCTGGNPVYLEFHEYHDIAAGGVGYLSVWSPTGQIPSAVDAASAYDAEVNGRQGYQGQSGGWRKVTFDLTPWQCNSYSLYWNLYLNEASATGFGWAIDDIVQVYFDNRAQGSFAPGPIWDGGITRLHDGVNGCGTSPAGFEFWGTDQWGNALINCDVAVEIDATGTAVFTDANPGYIVSQTPGAATINTGPSNSTRVWFTNTVTETVNIDMLTGSGSDPTVSVDFVDVTADETGLCGDLMNNDCDAFPDCLDPECIADPSCCSNTDILLNEVFGGSPDYIEVINTCSIPWDIGGLQIRWDMCDANTYTFPASTIVPPGGTFRLVESSSCMLPNEICFGMNICDNPTGSGWVTLCDGACDVATCSNMLDYLEKGAPSGTPVCAGFTPNPLDVSGTMSNESASRVAYDGGGANGLLTDWAVLPISRD